MGAGVAPDQVSERVAHRLGERLRHAHRQRHAERVLHPAGVLDGQPALLAGDPDPDHPPGLLQLGQLAGGAAALGCTSAVVRSPSRRSRSATSSAWRTGRAPSRRCSEASSSASASGSTSSRSSARPSSSASSAGVEGQRLRPALGQRGVALVHERADVAEQQRPGERRRRRGLDLDHPDRAALDVAHQADQARHVEDVLQHLAHGLQHDREARVLAGDLQQLGGALALLPQRCPLAGVALGQQQRPGGALAEAAREQRGAADLVLHQRLDLVGVEHREVGRRAPRRCRAGAARCRRRSASTARPRRSARAAGPPAPAPTGRSPGRRTGSAPRPASRRARRGTARPRWCGRPARGRWPPAAPSR